MCRRRLLLLLLSLGAGCRRGSSSADDVVARTVGQELHAAELGGLLGNAKVRMELTPENGVIIANLWSSYHRLAYAAAHNDSLIAQIDTAIAPLLDNERVSRMLARLRAPVPRESASPAAYAAGRYGLYAVRHILFAFPPNATPGQRDSVQALALTVRRATTAANFAAMAIKYSGDRTSGVKGGDLGVFPQAAMRPAVMAIVKALKPDSISALVPSASGVDIVQRLSWADARMRYLPLFAQADDQARDSLVSDHLADASRLTVTSVGPTAARAAAADPVNGSRDTTTIATFDGGGRFTAADMLRWVNVMRPLQRVEVLRGLPYESDTVAIAFIRNLAVRRVLLRAADSARIGVPDSVKADLRARFIADLVQSWQALGVAPRQLSDSARTPTEREQLAASRARRFIERGMTGAVSLATVSIPVEAALDRKYETTLSRPALSRALTLAGQLRAGADSQRPPTPAPRAGVPAGPGRD